MIKSIVFYLNKLKEYDSNNNPRKFQEILDHIKQHIRKADYENLVAYYRNT